MWKISVVSVESATRELAIRGGQWGFVGSPPTDHGPPTKLGTSRRQNSLSSGQWAFIGCGRWTDNPYPATQSGSTAGLPALCPRIGRAGLRSRSGHWGAAPAQAVKGGSGSGVLAIFGFAGRHAVMGSVRRRRGRFRLGLPFLTPEEELLAEVGAGLWRDRQTLLGARRRRIGSQFGANRDIEPPPIVPRDRSRLQFTPNHRPRARGWALDALVALRIGSTMRVSYRPCGRSAPRDASDQWSSRDIGVSRAAASRVPAARSCTRVRESVQVAVV